MLVCIFAAMCLLHCSLYLTPRWSHMVMIRRPLSRAHRLLISCACTNATKSTAKIRASADRRLRTFMYALAIYKFAILSYANRCDLRPSHLILTAVFVAQLSWSQCCFHATYAVATSFQMKRDSETVLESQSINPCLFRMQLNGMYPELDQMDEKRFQRFPVSAE